jgi:chromosome partitioning protein
MAHVYALVNQKGGVGKTTSTINLGAGLASNGQKVLLIDMDPQANATSSLGIDKRKVKNGTYEVLLGAAPISPQILYNPTFKLSILPSSPALAGATIELIDMQRREVRLKEALSAVNNRYDYILIDCPPSLGILTINALVAASQGVIIPVQCEYLALEGLGQLIDTINQVKVTLQPDLTVRGVILTMYDGRTRLAVDVVSEVRKFFPNQVFDTIIPRSIRLAEAPSFGMPVSFYAGDSSASRAYSSLARELLEKDGVIVPI